MVGDMITDLDRKDLTIVITVEDHLASKHMEEGNHRHLQVTHHQRHMEVDRTRTALIMATVHRMDMDNRNPSHNLGVLVSNMVVSSSSSNMANKVVANHMAIRLYYHSICAG